LESAQDLPNGITKTNQFAMIDAANGTRLAEAGCDAFTIAQLLGHSDIRVTMRYVRAVETSKRVAVEAVRLNSGKVGQILARWPKQPATALAVND
jgi:hypothetical protein